ncbi:MAG: hypothetical protein KKH29_02565 [Candidatus Omnitrophica bacterium]|nr:hypothetical protein [Candidatus Omnitrophota bacterium]
MIVKEFRKRFLKYYLNYKKWPRIEPDLKGSVSKNVAFFIMITQIKKTDYTDWFRIMALIFAQCLLLWNISLAGVLSKGLNVPSQYGSIKEVFKATDRTQDTKRMIVLIQDAHCNYEAQKNMAQILKELIKEHNLRLIMVEGGSGNVGLSFLRSYADKEAREEVADRHLRQGKISGEEYLDIVSDDDFELYGIEDEGLYDAHLSAFFKVDSIKEEGLRYLESLYYIVEALKPHIYSQELRQLEKRKKNYEAKTISLVEYCQYLKDMVSKKGLNLRDYPQLAAFSETVRLEEEIDFKQAESERNTFIKALAKLLDDNALEELISKSKEFKAGELTPKDYYSFLKALARGKIDLEDNYSQLNSYIRYITVSKDISAGKLLEEVSLVEEKIKEACFANADERELSEISKAVNILTSLLNLELTPEDYEYYEMNRSKLVTASWKDFLAENCLKYNLAMYPSRSSVIDENMGKLENFYQLGVKREEAFIRNVANRMAESGDKLAVLIAGGFHTPGVTQMLKDKGYSYMVVTPAITKKTDSSSIYLSVLRGEKNRLKKALGD